MLPELVIVAGVAFTQHVDFVKQTHNEVHPHARVEMGNFIAGGFINSASHLGLYSGFKFDINQRTSIEIGGMTGYEEITGNFINPYLKGTYSVENLTLFAAPMLEEHKGELEPKILIGIEVNLSLDGSL